MNQHTQIGQDDVSHQIPALPINIEDICAGRDKSIEYWLTAYDNFHLMTEQAAVASFGGAVSIKIPHGHSYEDSRMAKAFHASGKLTRWSQATGQYEDFDAREEFRLLITQTIDRSNWRHLLDHCGFDALLDRQAREEFNDALREDPPAFTVENCAATFGEIYGNRREYFLRGIANTFMALDRRFRSHDGFKIGARLIINNAMSGFGVWNNYDRRDTLHDVERIFCELDGRQVRKIDHPESIVKMVSEIWNAGDLPQVAHGDYFRVRVFKNGNLHLWFERDDLLEQVNKLLAEFYGEVIGDSYDSTEADDAPEYHIVPAKGWGAFMSSEAVADRVANHARTYNKRVLEPSAGTGVLADMAKRNGASEVVCVEIQEGHAYELTRKGYQTHCKDFLSLDPSETGLFDCVVMNPPFDRGRDCDHVQHAMKFLKAGGCLVAVMSARAEYATDKRHKAFHKMVDKCGTLDWGRGKWFDLPAGSFAHAGTNVNTVILAIERPW